MEMRGIYDNNFQTFYLQEHRHLLKIKFIKPVGQIIYIYIKEVF